METRVLAFDFGASSGRAMLAVFDGTVIRMEEIHRFSNDPVMVGQTLHWDILRLLHEVKRSISIAAARGRVDCIGIDTWAVDFGLLDANGRLMQNPVHYRDRRTDGMLEELLTRIPKAELYAKTGIQFMQINTICQLYALTKQDPELLERAHKLLMIPDLISYFLTGEQRCEYTNASTTQLLDAVSKQWDVSLMQRLGIPARILCDIVQPASVYGRLSPELCDELGVPPCEVIAVASHDTASAVAAVPATLQDFVYISCGTWSLMGTELEAPLMDEKALGYNFTNEGGVNGTIRYLKNIMGLWLIQESRRAWQREGQEYSYADLERLALCARPFACFIDPDDPSFLAPGNIPERVREYCRRTGQAVPQSVGEVMRCIYESLALKYRVVLEQLSDCTGKAYSKIHVVGGGTKDGLLCRMTAAACNMPVLAGPKEATVLGNISVQLMAAGRLTGLSQAREVIAQSEETTLHLPEDAAAWETAYETFKNILA